MDGCGKEACATLACHLADHRVYQMPVSHDYASVEFKEHFKKVFVQAGLEGNPTVLMVANLNLDQASTFCLSCLLRCGIQTVAPRNV